MKAKAKPAKKRTKADPKLADKLPTTANKKRGEGIPFHPGYDPRRNYKGRPKDHDELREMIKNIGAQEIEVTTNAGETLKAPLTYFMLRDMFAGRDSRDHQNILEHGWGKVTQDVNLNFSKMTDDELAKYIAERTRAIGSGTDGSAEAEFISPGDDPDQET